jgi:hypothetical protein
MEIDNFKVMVFVRASGCAQTKPYSLHVFLNCSQTMHATEIQHTDLKSA